MARNNKNITIFEGAIKLMWVSNLILVDNQIKPVINKDLVVIPDAKFYLNRFRNFINLDYDCKLPDETEVRDNIDNFINNRKDAIYYYLQNPAVSEEEREKYLREFAFISAEKFYVPSELDGILYLSGREFKKYKKNYYQDACEKRRNGR